MALCEDTQHEVFLRRFLKRRGWDTTRLRVEKAPPGRGSGEQFVRESFVPELKAFRARCHYLNLALIVMIDGDRSGIIVGSGNSTSCVEKQECRCEETTSEF